MDNIHYLDHIECDSINLLQHANLRKYQIADKISSRTLRLIKDSMSSLLDDPCPLSLYVILARVLFSIFFLQIESTCQTRSRNLLSLLECGHRLGSQLRNLHAIARMPDKLQIMPNKLQKLERTIESSSVNVRVAHVSVFGNKTSSNSGKR
jgi:hypothetical protein